MGKRQEIRKKRIKKVQSQRRIVLISVIGLSLLISAFIIFQSQKPVGEIKMIAEKTRPETSGLSMGNPAAPIVVEEFSDFQCIACYRFWQNYEEDFIARYVATGDVLFKYVPFSFLGGESIQAAEAAYCALDEGKFWDYHDTLFLNWNGENTGNFSDKRLVAFAGALGLDEGNFRTCLNSNRYNKEVLEGLRYGKTAGVNATPTFLVNGKLVYSDALFSTLDELSGK
ncbi:MAG: thioredoxin domain-containing protein [Anaerolineaceae bacterium]|jgi:protein-disulfide isomerase|nr:thioredoxin domain-containing protein [Anaerolineaceae bacterium]